MTDGEPEPFRMPTEPDANEPEGTEPDATELGEEPAATPEEGSPTERAENIADLIDEASRTAAEQTARKEAGEVPEDRSADVWGDDGVTAEGDADTDTDADADAVWAAAEGASSGHVVWSEADAEGDVWADTTDTRTPPLSADPAREAAAARPAAADDEDSAPGEDEPDTFSFAIGDDRDDDGGGADDRGAAPVVPPAEAEEPDPFHFDAGPDTSAPMPVDDQPDDDVDEPEAFSFAVDEGSPQDQAPDASSTPTASTDSSAERTDTGGTTEWTVPSSGPADEDEEPETDVWTSDVTTETEQHESTEDVEDAGGTMAESARPREVAGWRDLEAEKEPEWSVPDLPVRRHQDQDDEEEPAGFAAAVDDTDDDAPWTSGPAVETVDEDDHDAVDEDAPWTSGPAAADEPQEPEDPHRVDDEAVDLPADVVTAQVHDALGDLLGNEREDAAPVTPATAGPPAAAPPTATSASDATASDGLDQFDELDDLDLDQFDDLDAADEPVAEESDDAEPDDAAAEHEDDDRDQETLDAPTAARQVMDPGSVTFSSGGKKKRGLFG